MTQRELADKLRMGDQQISNIECGRALPGLVSAVLIEDLTGIPVRAWARVWIERAA